MHSALNGLGVTALIAGIVVIGTLLPTFQERGIRDKNADTNVLQTEMNKADHPESRFTSAHGKLGLLTFILIGLQAVVGFVQYFTPTLVFGSVDNGKAIYKYHR